MNTNNRNKIKAWGLSIFLLGSVFMPACTKQQPEQTLSGFTLSETKPIEVPYSGSEVSVSVSGTLGSWTAFPMKEWVRVAKEGDRLTLRVSANESARPRTTEVKVSSGGVVKVLEVRQEGKPLEFTSQKDIQFGQFGGNKKFFVNASSPDWTVTASDSWLKVTPNTERGEILIHTEENTARTARSAKIEVKDLSGKVVHSVEVHQKEILYYFLPYPHAGASAEVIRLFETERYSRLLNQPDMMVNFSQWAYETVSPIFNYIMYSIRNGKFVSATLYTTNRDASLLKGEKGAEVIDFLRQNGYEKQLDVLYYNSETNCEVNIVTTSRNPNITFSYYPDQKPMPSFDRLPIGLTKFCRVKKVTLPDGEVEIHTIQEGETEHTIFEHEANLGWTFIPPYDPYAPENAEDDPETRDRKRDQSSRKIRVPLFFGAKQSNPDHWREFYNYMVFEKDGQYKAYELGRVYEDYINDYVDPSHPFYGQKSRRVSGTQMEVARQTFKNPLMFMYEHDGYLYVTKEFRKLLAEEGFFFDSTFDRDRGFIYYNPERKIELMFRFGKTIYDGDDKPGVVIMQLVPRDIDLGNR